MAYDYKFKFEDDDTGLTYDCTATLVNYRDSNYGADADGRRGITKDFPECESITIRLYGVVIENRELTKLIDKHFDKYHLEDACDKCIENDIAFRYGFDNE